MPKGDEGPQGESSGEGGPAKRWYIVHAKSGCENLVARTLAERIIENHLQASFGEILVPAEEVIEMRGGKRRRSSRKFFPGYVLVQMEMDDTAWHFVREIPNVIGFIGASKGQKTPSPITDKEADRIMQRIEEGVTKPRPKTLYEPGEAVRVIDGPFVDFNGVVEEVNYAKSRLRVAVTIFGRSTPVELEFGQVEKS
ncbi:MAG: transcription termination/antitermination protein NusG [Gammaproteobacteria bacterium]